MIINTNKVFGRFISILLVFLWSQTALASAIRLAIQNTGNMPQWDILSQFSEKKNQPIIAIPTKWPVVYENIAPLLPPSNIPLLLQIEFDIKQKTIEEEDLNRLINMLTTYNNISHLSFAGLEKIKDSNYLVYILKKLSSVARGIRPAIKIAIAISDRLCINNFSDFYVTLATNPDVSPYFESFFLDTSSNDKIRNNISKKAPHITFWETICIPDKSGEKWPDPSRILSCILKGNPFEKYNVSLLIIPSRQPAFLYQSFVRFSSYLEEDLYLDSGNIKIILSNGSSSSLPLFIKSTKQTPILFLEETLGKKVKVILDKGKYQKALVENLVDGKFAVFNISRNSTALVLKINKNFHVVNLIPQKKGIMDTKYEISVSRKFKLSAEKIIAYVRAKKSVQKNKLRSFTATMTTSLRLRVANFNETFDLTIKGPMFAESDKPYDWVWKEFFINGVRWKRKTIPKIPLLQPEKVNILPLDINLSEQYLYSLAGETTIYGHQAYIIDFKPKKELKTSSLYYGRIWIDTKTFTCLREQLTQLNLRGEVLSNNESRRFEPIQGESEIWLPTSVKGHQTFSIAGRITNVERKVTLSNIVINPENYKELKEEAFNSGFRMVRDTDKGLRYLIKNKKNNKLSIEWKTKKSQLFAVFGSFYDSSFSYPVPIIGINYMNFDLGGKGRQVNVLWGGPLLMANYSDPTFLGTKIDVGAAFTGFFFPLNNTIYQKGSPIEEEKIKKLLFRFQVNTGFPIGSYLKLSSKFFIEYNKFSRTKTTGENFILPQNTLTLAAQSQLTANYKGYRLSLWGLIAERNRWEFWGIPENYQYYPEQKSFIRWRVVGSKDFFFSGFKKLNISVSYFDGLRLDRFSAYKFGFFSEIKMRGFVTGVVQAHRAFMLNLSYGYSIGKAFRLEASYDSICVTNKYTNYFNTYFSSAAISGTINIPWINMILRFETGLPVVNHGIKGLVVYLVLLKMF